MTEPQAMGCYVCGAYGDGTEALPSRYEGGAVWRRYRVEHRGGVGHSFETTNLPQDDERYQGRELQWLNR